MKKLLTANHESVLFMKDKFKLLFCHSDGRSADLELCCFCKRNTDLAHPEKCEHFSDDYEGNQCTAFNRVDNAEKRVLEALDIKCGKIKH